MWNMHYMDAILVHERTFITQSRRPVCIRSAVSVCGCCYFCSHSRRRHRHIRSLWLAFVIHSVSCTQRPAHTMIHNYTDIGRRIYWALQLQTHVKRLCIAHSMTWMCTRCRCTDVNVFVRWLTGAWRACVCVLCVYVCVHGSPLWKCTTELWTRTLSKSSCSNTLISWAHQRKKISSHKNQYNTSNRAHKNRKSKKEIKK